MVKKEILKEYKYISFDLYDTLLKRNVKKPADIFLMVEKEYNNEFKKEITNFCENRILAEKKCREKSAKEVSLNDIYDCLSIYYENEELQRLMDIELRIEYDSSQINNNHFVRELYDYAINNKKVIVTTDMYLPETFIKKVLSKIGVQYDKLFLSSTVGEKKSSSRLYKYILEDLKISNKDIIHIGDNYYSDRKMAKKAGIKSIIIRNQNIVRERCFNETNINIINSSILSAFINNNCDEDYNFYEKYGYMALGPLLYSVVLWLNKLLTDDRIHKVYFLARDGKIIKEAYNIIFPNNNSVYMMASRRSLIIPSLYKCKSIEEMIKKIHIKEHITINELLKKLGIDEVDEKDKNNKIFYKEFNIDYIVNNYKILLDKYYEKIVNNSKYEMKYLNKYLNSIDFREKVAIVDIGWHGNMQDALCNVSKATIKGYYVGLRPNRKKNINAEAYLFDYNHNLDLYEKEMISTSLFEYMFTTSHGSVKRFVNNNDLYELSEYEYKNSKEEKILKEIQKGAISFVKRMNDDNIKYYLKNDCYTCSSILFDYLSNPTLDIAKKLGSIRFKDGSINYIAKPNRLFYYIIHPKKFKKDIEKSTWKIGFLKRLLKLPLPYDKIYFKIKKMRNRGVKSG